MRPGTWLVAKVQQKPALEAQVEPKLQLQQAWVELDPERDLVPEPKPQIPKVEIVAEPELHCNQDQNRNQTQNINYSVLQLDPVLEA